MSRQRYALPPGFAFLNIDDPEAGRLLLRIPPHLHEALADELALAYFTGYWECHREWDPTPDFLERLADAARALRKAERILKAAGYNRTRLEVASRLRAQVELDAQNREAVRALTALREVPFCYWPRVVRVRTKPFGWRQFAIDRMRAIGIGRPTASALVSIAAEAGRCGKDRALPARVSDTYRRVCQARRQAHGPTLIKVHRSERRKRGLTASK